MPNTHITKNYFAHGVDQLVIGGRLTFLPGAVVEGGEGLFDVPAGGDAALIPFIPDSTATTVATLREDYNRLLSALRSVGLMASTTEPSGGGDG